ncbi:MAG: thiamine-monophosphate kinase [Frankiaceae bacterium]|nr:thiamine-monophosphate kinase [Frankiaceae bacterium]
MAEDPTLADVGEFALIERIGHIVGRGAVRPGDVGIGDDAAVLSLGTDPRVVATTDVLVEGRHFRLDWSSAYDIGRKAAAQNIADIEAMGARPVCLLVGLAASGTTTVRFAEGIARGLADEAASVGAVVAGGDTVGADQITVSVTALGSLDGRAPVLRSGAGVGDELWLAGLLGWSAAGLALLERGDADLIGRHREVVDSHLVPRPPYGYGELAAAAGATSMIDVSDGLLADLQHVLDASGVGADLTLPECDDIVIAAARDLGVDPGQWLRGGGEDHALLFTIPGNLPPPAHVSLRRLGTISAAVGIRIDGVAAEADVFDHFAPRA